MSIYKKNIILLAILILCFAFTIVYGYGFRNFINQPKLPSKYSAYKSIDSGASSTNYEVKQLLNGEINNLYFELPIQVKNVFIIHATSAFSDNPRNIYYKIDSIGTLTDSLIYKTDEFALDFQKGYLIHKDFYRSWALNGDTSKQIYININYDLKLDSTAMLNQFLNLSAKSSVTSFVKYNSLWDNDDPKYKHKTDKVLCLIKDKWYAYYGANLYSYKEKQHNKQNLIKSELIGKQTSGKPENNFDIVYFHKTEQMSTNNWLGQAFINMKINNDILKLRYELRFEGDTKIYTYNELKLYTSQDKKYQVLSSGRMSYYVIKPKSK